MRKKMMILFLAAALASGYTGQAEAVEFKGSGEWLLGVGGVESTLVKDHNGGRDVFEAQQRFRLQLEAVVSESLSGTLRLQIGDITWGRADEGGALGADGTIVKVRDAYIDWTVPNTELKLRMGLQNVILPNAAGGSSVLDEQAAAVVASWRFSETVGLTAFWVRPFNDNYVGYSGVERGGSAQAAGMFDNADYVGLSVPVRLEGVELTPWLMVGGVGRNAVNAVTADGEALASPLPYYALPMPLAAGNVQDGSFMMRRSYATQFYAGLPLILTALEPWNVELDLNYGYAEGWGRYSVTDRLGVTRRADSARQGWLAKALVEYKMDWGTPGLLAWYASGDDGDVKNGSERMPAIAPSANFTSFMQDGPNGWSLNGGYDLMLTYAGTWGLGVQVQDLSFIEGLQHTVRAVYWGGTNDAAMIRQTSSPQAWRQDGGLYLTTLDHLWEFNVDSRIQIYENLEAIVELGYIVNGMDRSAWRKHSAEVSLPNADAWKAALLVKYSF